MLKKRIIGVIVVQNDLAVQSLGFSRYLPIGRPEIVAENLNRWGVDEIAVIDIDATKNRRLNLDLIRRLSPFCQVPLTYGGGIRTCDEMTNVIQSGADKIMVNNTFRNNPDVVRQGAEQLGRQCMVISLDIVRTSLGGLKIYDYADRSISTVDAKDLVLTAQSAGAGELFINFVGRDGFKKGYDLEGAQIIASAVSIPVILCGGAGHPAHFGSGLEIPNISAVAAANFFNFSEHSVTMTKQYLIQTLGPFLRHDTYFNYADATFMDTGRLAKKNDQTLKNMLFERHPQEII